MTAWKWDDTKPGPQMAAVMVHKKPMRGNAMVLRHEDGSTWHCVVEEALCLLPPSLTPEQAAVIEKASYAAGVFAVLPRSSQRPHEVALIDAVDALRASLAPRDPVAEVKAAMAEYESTCLGSDESAHAYARLRSAIAALSERGT